MAELTETIEIRVTPAMKASTKQAAEIHPDVDSDTLSEYTRLQYNVGNRTTFANHSSSA